jgi:hypothetical protein
MAGLLQPYTVCPHKELCLKKKCTLSHPPLHYRRSYKSAGFDELLDKETGVIVSQYGHYLVNDTTALEPLRVMPTRGKYNRGRRDLQWLFPTALEQAAIDLRIQEWRSEHSTTRCATSSFYTVSYCIHSATQHQQLNK